MSMKNVNGIDAPLGEADLAQRAIDAATPLPVALLPPVSGRQFKAALAIMGVITEAEMISAELPAVGQPVLAGMTTHERIIARATWPNLREVRGDEALLAAFAAAHDPPLGAAEIEQIMAIARSVP
jgi:hypothetical protein